MEQMITLITNSSVLVVIAAVFIWDNITNNKTVQKVLAELTNNAELQKSALDNLSRVSDNIATALNIIQNTLASNTQLLNNNTQSFDRHDQRAEFMNGDIRKILAHVETQYGSAAK